MKRLLIVLLLLAFTSFAYAGAATVTGTSTPYYSRSDGKLEGYIVHLICTASSPATTLSNSIDTISGVSTYLLNGTRLNSVKAYPGATAPTDATDITITDPYGIDLLGGKGTDLIDSASKTETLVGPSGAYAPMRSIGTKSISITNNSVSEAIMNIVLDFVTR